MYGYCTPRKPELSRIRVMTSRSEVDELQRCYATLSLEDVLAAIARAGPLRAPVERELDRLARAKR